MPEEEQQKLAADLRVLEDDKENVEKVLRELGASMEGVDQGDKAELAAKLREEAWTPTIDAIGVSLFSSPSYTLPHTPDL